MLGLAGVVTLVVVLTQSTKPAAHRVESIFQDDRYLLYSPAPTVAKTLAELRALGVDRVRLSIIWGAIAPGRNARVRPRRFDGANPADYSAAAWAPYDRVVELARAHGIAVDFNVTAPGPLWAMAAPAPNTKAADHYRPSPSEFGDFVLALGRRYSGTYTPPTARGVRSSALPRVSYWTIWNEPNQPGWLYPQWRAVAGQRAMDSPRLYRLYVDAAVAALSATGHSHSSDTILIGELAPEGRERSGDADPIAPMQFLRALYCVDASYRPLGGASAGSCIVRRRGRRRRSWPPIRDCFKPPGWPTTRTPSCSRRAPTWPMRTSSRSPTFRASSRPGSDLHHLRGAPSAPDLPDRVRIRHQPSESVSGVSPARQSLYLNEAQYMVWKDPRVRSLAQFLLYDSPPDRSYPRGTPGYWSTFQTGLRYGGGQPKPSLNSYRLPIFIPDPVSHGGASVFVWAMLRPAPNNTAQQAQIQWRSAHGGYRTLTTVRTSDPDGFLTARVKLPGTGAVRISWSSPARQVFHSRAVGVRAG